MCCCWWCWWSYTCVSAWYASESGLLLVEVMKFYVKFNPYARWLALFLKNMVTQFLGSLKQPQWRNKNVYSSIQLKYTVKEDFLLLKVPSQKLLRPNLTVGFRRIWSDFELWPDLVRLGRIWLEFVGICWILSDSVGFGQFRSDSVRFGPPGILESPC